MGGLAVQLATKVNDDSQVNTIGGMVSDSSNQQLLVYTLVEISEDGIVTVHQDQIDQFNSWFENNTLYYLGFSEIVSSGGTPSEMDYVSLDNVKLVSGIHSTANIYVKEDSWELLNGKDIDSLRASIDKNTKTLENKAEIIPIEGYSSYYGVRPNVYTTRNIESTSSFIIKLAAIEDTTIYNEYILELKCTSTPSSIAFNNADGTAATIVWANGIAPTFEAGMTYIISIANSFGVYSMFSNS